MKPITRSIRTTFGAAALGCAATLCAAWPSPGNAADDAPAAEEPPLPPDSAEVGDLAITSEVKPASNGRWVFAMHALNRSSDRRADARLQAVVEEQVFEAESRSAPMPEIAWHAEETVSVPPGESVTRTWDIPRQLAFRIQKALADLKRMEAGQAVVLSRTYTASVREVLPEAQGGARARGNGARFPQKGRLAAVDFEAAPPQALLPAASAQPASEASPSVPAGASAVPRPVFAKAPVAPRKKARRTDPTGS